MAFPEGTDIDVACRLIAERAIHHIDAGRTLLVDEVRTHIDDGSVLEWLGAQLNDQTIASYGVNGRLHDVGAGILDRMQRSDNAYGPRRWEISNNGIALVAAYAVHSSGIN